LSIDKPYRVIGPNNGLKSAYWMRLIKLGECPSVRRGGRLVAGRQQQQR